MNGLKLQATALTVTSTMCQLEGVFVQIGLVPNTEWLKGTVELDKFGENRDRCARAIPNCARRVRRWRLHHRAYNRSVIAAGAGATAALSALTT